MKQRVCVGLSGGVDSSVAAKRLLEHGYDVIGVFIKTWYPDFISCSMEAERLDAMRVAAHLGIPFYTCDAERAYKEGVADYMIREYQAGRTPNPDVMCNREVKFGTFYNFACSLGATHIATGHYARIEERYGVKQLLRGVDPLKDQSYFLWTLTEDDLEHTFFPIGATEKEEVRIEASSAKLPTAKKHDSQGICFLGEIDIESFLSHYIDLKPGSVLNPLGEVIGTHNGVQFLTLGQRHGFTITDPKYAKDAQYIINKNMAENTITVGTTFPEINEGSIIHLAQVNIRSSLQKIECAVQFRYRQTPVKASIDIQSDATARVCINESNIEKPSPGQSCVFYDGEICLGGGIIETVG